MKFVTVDVETANESLASICQIGVAFFEDGKLDDAWCSHVNPQTFFSSINVSIHGIDEKTVKKAPTLEDLLERIQQSFADTIVAHYTHFDKSALCRALPGKLDDVQWLDIAKVVRRQWEQFSYSGYGLAPVAEFLNIDNKKHHDAMSDAVVAGSILVAAVEKSGQPLDWWVKRITQPINTISSTPIKLSGNPDGLLFGETIVFTGTLTMSRRDAASAAAQAGCNVADAVTKKTTLLLVGDQDIQKLAGKEKSSKHIYAEELITKGRPIRILAESDFLEILKP